MNRVTLVGRITRDPELRNSANGTAFVSFSIAVNRVMPNAQGERVADFINCVVFNKQAENLARFQKKGNLIGVEGRLQTRTYQAQDGSNRYTVDVVCDNISFLEPKSQGANQGAFNDYSSYQENYNQLPQSEMQAPAQPRYQQPSYAQPAQNAQPRYQQPSYAQPAPQPAPKQAEPAADPFAGQFKISDDDLPF